MISSLFNVVQYYPFGFDPPKPAPVVPAAPVVPVAPVAPVVPAAPAVPAAPVQRIVAASKPVSYIFILADFGLLD